MIREAAPSTGAERERHEPLQRLRGRLTGSRPGPTLICIGAVHGNEPAGLLAIDRVLDTLARRDIPMRGTLIGLAGNLAALADRDRYVDVDLNRRWLTGRRPSALRTEDREREELIQALEHEFAQASGPVYCLDLHTTSGEGPPFLLLGDTLPNRGLATSFPIPMVLGLEEHLDGTLSEFLTYRGHVALAIECGQHESTAAVDNAEAAIWVGLCAAGLVDERDVPEVGDSRARLAETTRGMPRIMEVRHRHPVAPGDRFQMEPGFRSFDPIRPAQLLARDRNGEIRSRWEGRLLMPLYQAQGNDGFFVVREFHPAWLHLSAALRRLGLGALAHWLPGVTRHPTRPDTLVVDRRIARWRSMEVLHLLGFRRARAAGGLLLVSRRVRGRRPPAAAG